MSVMDVTGVIDIVDVVGVRDVVCASKDKTDNWFNKFCV